MRILYHSWLSAESRKVRLVLNEKGLEYELKAELYWERREKFLKLNPTGEVPVLIEGDGTIISDSAAISEYIDETHNQSLLMGEGQKQRCEVRRLVGWFDKKFKTEVTNLMVQEKVLKRFLKMGIPDSETIRCALHNLKIHMAYISYLSERKNYLAGNEVSMADLTAAGHISVLDYLGDISWEDWPSVKEWYMRVKSRKSFRSILKDRIAGMTPPLHYEKLDF
ncbi:MAG: glutathione S-transferase family protein [Sphingomonadales bacterium]